MSLLVPIPTSPATRWRTARERVLPVIVLSLSVVAVVVLWRQQALQGHVVGIAEGARSLVSSAQPGFLEELGVGVYDYVEAGQVVGVVRLQDPRSQIELARMELDMVLAQRQPSLPEENALDYERVRLDLLRTEAELAIARVNLLRAENEERRSRPLYREKLVSEDAYDLTLQTRNLHLADVLAKSNIVVEMRHRIESLRPLGEPATQRASEEAAALRECFGALRAQANTNLAPYKLVAPIRGMVTAVHRQAGEQVVAGEPLITISSPESDRIVGYLRQPYTVTLGVGQRVRVMTREYPRRTFWSQVSQIGAQVEVLTNSAAFLRFGMLVDSALPFLVQVPAHASIRPGELVDLAVSRTPVASSREAQRRLSEHRRSVRVNPVDEGPLVTYTGMCDASAGVALNADWIVVADDEESVLRVYDRSRGGSALQVVDLGTFLRRRRSGKEADIEGSARAGDLIYWVSSHGRNADGELQPSRYRFFATRVAVREGEVVLRPEGRPYTRLLEDLLREPLLAPFNLKQAASLAPKSEGGLNIEGLCLGPEGSLLLGFRNPVPEGKALVIALLNPEDLLKEQPARFGPPRLVDLGGRGVRSLEQFNGQYYIVAGPWSGKADSCLYFWDGTDQPARRIEEPRLAGLNPEAITVFDRAGIPWLHALSDDGAITVGGVEAKRLRDPGLRMFRGVSFPLSSGAHPKAALDPHRRTPNLSSDTRQPACPSVAGESRGASRPE